MRRLDRTLVGTWSGMNDADTFTLEIDEQGCRRVDRSGAEQHGWIQHEQHLEDDHSENFIFDDMGFPVPNGCGALRMLFPDADEVQAGVTASTTTAP